MRGESEGKEDERKGYKGHAQKDSGWERGKRGGWLSSELGEGTTG